MIDDLRQGVDATQHEVLDLIEASGFAWAGLGPELQLYTAAELARCASRHVHLPRKREIAIEAAARLIDGAAKLAAELAEEPFSD